MRHSFLRLVATATATTAAAIGASAAHAEDGADAVPVTVVAYDITETPSAGWGGWNHTYDGTITPTGRTFHGGPLQAYTGGGGTLNDGIVPTGLFGSDAVQLFWVGPATRPRDRRPAGHRPAPTAGLDRPD